MCIYQVPIRVDMSYIGSLVCWLGGILHTPDPGKTVAIG